MVHSWYEGTVNNYSHSNINPSTPTTPSRRLSSVQQADTIGGPQHAEELQRERGDLLSGAHRRQPVRHGAGHGVWRRQEEALQLERSGGGDRWQPSQPQHFPDQWPWWVPREAESVTEHARPFKSKKQSDFVNQDIRGWGGGVHSFSIRSGDIKVDGHVTV